MNASELIAALGQAQVRVAQASAAYKNAHATANAARKECDAAERALIAAVGAIERAAAGL